MATEARLLYLDASALVKLVVPERETDALSQHLVLTSLLTSEVASVEVPRAAFLRSRSDAVLEAAERLLRRIHLLPLDDGLYREAARLRPAELRSLDALHLASALRVHNRINAMVVYDRRLASAAEAAGLRVEAPGRP